MADEMKHFTLELKKISRVGEDYYVFDFIKPKDFLFIEGQYGAFMHVSKDIEGRKVRAFSIASSTKENFVRIATKIIEKPSDFKDKMRSLQPGEKMTMDGPLGNFILEEKMKAVFIAGGIGITPIRSNLMRILSSDYNKETELIYAEDRESYPFSNDLDKIDKVKIYYTNSVEKTKKAIDNSVAKLGNEAVYYMAGSPNFIRSIKGQLEMGGIQTKNIKFDQFNGY